MLRSINAHRVEVTRRSIRWQYSAHVSDFEQEQSDLLYRSLINNRTDLAKLLMQSAGVDANARYITWADGQRMVVTPLIVAASCASLELVKFLCENGAEVETTTDRNESPLYVAALFGRVDVVKYLIEEHQASFEHGNTVRGFTPVEVASCMSAYDAEHYLLASGAAPSKRKSCIDFDLVDPFNAIDRRGGLEWSQQMEGDTSFLARRRAFELLAENTLGVPLGMLCLDAL